MKKTIKFVTAFLCAMTVLCIPVVNTFSANAELLTAEENAEPRGLYTNIEIELKVSGQTVTACAKNTFTFLPSEVPVEVYLYSSDILTEDYTRMTLESYGSIADLNMGKTLEVSASINGTPKFWMGYVKYRLDAGEWQTKHTDTIFVSATGEVVS